MKAVDHWDGAKRRIEIKDGGSPLAIDNVPVDLDAVYRWEKSSENCPHSGCSLQLEGQSVPRTRYLGEMAKRLYPESQAR